MKMNKTVLLTGLFASAVGLVGCSSNTTAIKEAVDIDKQSYTMESVKKSPAPVNYLEKTNLKFQTYEYEDEYIGLGVDLMRDEDESLYEFEISIPAVSRNKIAFKEQLNLAINSIGFTDKDAETIYSKIEECLSDEYLNSKKIAKKIKEEHYIEVNLLKDKDSKVTMILEDPDKFNTLIYIQIETNKNNIDEYLKSSKIKFQEADYLNLKTGLSLSQTYFGDDSVELYLNIPLKNIKDTEFREQLELMIRSVGGTNEDFKNAISTIEGKLKLDEKKEIKIANDFVIYIIKEKLSEDDYDICIGITNDNIDINMGFDDNTFDDLTLYFSDDESNDKDNTK